MSLGNESKNTSKAVRAERLLEGTLIWVDADSGEDVDKETVRKTLTRHAGMNSDGEYITTGEAEALIARFEEPKKPVAPDVYIYNPGTMQDFLIRS